MRYVAMTFIAILLAVAALLAFDSTDPGCIEVQPQSDWEYDGTLNGWFSQDGYMTAHALSEDDPAIACKTDPLVSRWDR